MSLLGIPSKEIKATLATADQTLAEWRAVAVEARGILSDLRALTAALRAKLLEEK